MQVDYNPVGQSNFAEGGTDKSSSARQGDEIITPLSCDLCIFMTVKDQPKGFKCNLYGILLAHAFAV